MRIKRVLSAVSLLLILALISIGGVTGVYAAQSRVFDDADLFSTEEKEEFESTIQSIQKEMNMDVVIATTQDTGGKSAKDYAENFYIERKFGTGSDYRGVLFLIDMDNREMYILPVGKMNRFLTDKRWNAILDDAYEAVSGGDYAACARIYLDGVIKYYRAGIPGGQYNYDKDTGKISVYRSIRWYEAALAVLAAAAAAAAVCGGVTSQYSMKKERGRARGALMSYRANCEFAYSAQNDNLINKTITHVIVPRNNGGNGGSGGGMSSGGRSTTHTSSGRTMGGGGRKF
ncbi:MULTISPECIES: TPM domain-containing protein [Lacrimispora]|jgi:uncharacterized protein|uniref:TPM domain-containing protein n=1 Tax=Lacrimispora TaxID=2719231 RepID=UPI000BE33762|nr:TPM domain-containing protein [Lacrimispora amygdalina]MDK2965990.1 uncharacterized protein [Lacrimispora sp.]